MTDRQQLERLMAIVKQAREAQNTYFKGRRNASAEHVKNLLNDARMKENSLDNLITQLEKQGYRPNKYETNIEQGKMFE
jgi:spore germination protein YaaH